MAVLNAIRKVRESFPKSSPDAKELARLQRFLIRMKAAGVASTREYDLPRPDTIGRESGPVAQSGRVYGDRNLAARTTPNP